MSKSKRSAPPGNDDDDGDKYSSDFGEIDAGDAEMAFDTVAGHLGLVLTWR